MSKLGHNLAQFWSNIQASLFPFLEEELDFLSKKQQQLVSILELVRIEEYIPDFRWYEGRPRKSRCAIARSFYDLMDAAYDVPGIIDHSRLLDHVPLIDKNPRRNKALADELDAEFKRQKMIHMVAPEKIRYNERTTAERANSRLKDEFGGF